MYMAKISRTRRATMASICVAGALAVMSGCGRESAPRDGHGGTLVIATGGDADVLFPPLVLSTQGRVVSEQLFEPLAEVGDSLNVIGDRGFRPRLAQSWSWSADSLSIAFHLNPRARWHDGRPVRASDVVFTYRLYGDTALGGPAAGTVRSIDSVTVHDSLTPIVWFHVRAPQQFYTAASQMLILPEHVYGSVPVASLASSDILRHPVGSGRFRFVRWVPGTSIELASNADHYTAPARLDRVIWTIAHDPGAAATSLLAGDADFLESLRPEMVLQAEHAPNVRVVSSPGFRYGYLVFDLRDSTGAPHRLFADRALRRALTLAVDRDALVRSAFDSLALPGLGPFVRSMPTVTGAIREIPYDPAAAARALDSLGWHAAPGTGLRSRQGTPLRFSILTPSSSKDRARLAVLLQSQLRSVGVDVQIHSVDNGVYMRELGSHAFDAALVAWLPDPDPSTVLGSWGSASAAEKGSSNFARYASATFDREIDSAMHATSLAAARPLYDAAYQTIVDDAPAIWLYESRNVVGVQRRVHLAPMRADAWWAHLADWYVPPGEQIARDRVPVTHEPAHDTTRTGTR